MDYGRDYFLNRPRARITYECRLPPLHLHAARGDLAAVQRAVEGGREGGAGLAGVADGGEDGGADGIDRVIGHDDRLV